MPDTILRLQANLPKGWLIGSSMDFYPAQTIVEGLDSPTVVVVLVNRDTTFNNIDQQVEQHPSLVLNFFDILEIDEINSKLRNHISFSGYPAIPYDTTAEFLILSSKLLQNHGFYSNEADELVDPLHQFLHAYFDDLK